MPGATQASIEDEQYSRDALGYTKFDKAIHVGYGDGPLEPEYEPYRAIMAVKQKGRYEGTLSGVGYAEAALSNAGFTTKNIEFLKSGQSLEDFDIIVTLDEDNGVGMLYMPSHNAFEYSF